MSAPRADEAGGLVSVAGQGRGESSQMVMGVDELLEDGWK